jgi:4-hydroxy-tetrahydrodipicolinate synthase
MIAALKETIALYAEDAAWRTVRPPLLPLDSGEQASLAVELAAIGFTMPGLARAEAAAR